MWLFNSAVVYGWLCRRTIRTTQWYLVGHDM